MIERISKGRLTRLKRKNRSSCGLPTCQKPFQIGDEVIRLGKKFFHRACEPKAYMDYDSRIDSGEAKA
jgi:hypothetical protein